MSIWGYYLDKHLDEFEEFVRMDKDSKILDVAAGTGVVGQKVDLHSYIICFQRYDVNILRKLHSIYVRITNSMFLYALCRESPGLAVYHFFCKILFKMYENPNGPLSWAVTCYSIRSISYQCYSKLEYKNLDENI